MDRLFCSMFLFFSRASLNHGQGQTKVMFLSAPAPMNYTTAVSYCRERGMSLPSTLSMIEHTALMKLMNTSNTSKVWLSVRREMTEEWLSVNRSNEGSMTGVRFPSNNETENKRCLAIRENFIGAVACFNQVDGALCYSEECRMCLPWNCARLEEGCIWVIFNVPNWFAGRSECKAAGGDLWTLSDVWEDSFSNLKVEQEKKDFWVGWRKDDWVIDTADTVLRYQVWNYFENDKGTEFSCTVISYSDQINWRMYNCSRIAATVCQVNGSKSGDEGEGEQRKSPNSPACECRNTDCEKPGSVMITVLLGCVCPLMIILITFGFYMCIRKRKGLREYTKQYRERLHQSRIMEQLYDTLTFSRNRSKSNAAKSSNEEMTKEMPVYAVVRKKSKTEKDTPGSGFHCTVLGEEDDANNTEVIKREDEKDSLVSERDKYGTYINLEE